jgi:hypothetical protein
MKAAYTLPSLYNQMVVEANNNGESVASLPRGVKVVVVNRGEQHIVAVWRKKVRVSDSDERTFKRDFSIPPGATRMPAKDQALHTETNEEETEIASIPQTIIWYGFAWRWQ